MLRDWHRRGMRGLRFHVFSDAGRPGYVRGVGLDVLETFRPVMRELGWVMQGGAIGACYPTSAASCAKSRPNCRS
jgi:hypothetical protein